MPADPSSLVVFDDHHDSNVIGWLAGITIFQKPIGGEISVAFESSLHKFTPKTAKENALDEQLKTGMFATSIDVSNARGRYYTSIPHVIKHRGIDVQQLTTLNLDKTQLWESVLQKDYGGSEDLLLGELQFAFVAFLMGQSLEAFLQWKSLVTFYLDVLKLHCCKYYYCGAAEEHLI